MNKRFCKQLKMAVKDERDGIQFYGKTVKNADKQSKKTLRTIQSQERKHYKKIKRLIRKHC